MKLLIVITVLLAGLASCEAWGSNPIKKLGQYLIENTDSEDLELNWKKLEDLKERGAAQGLGRRALELASLITSLRISSNADDITKNGMCSAQNMKILVEVCKKVDGMQDIFNPDLVKSGKQPRLGSVLTKAIDLLSSTCFDHIEDKWAEAKLDESYQKDFEGLKYLNLLNGLLLDEDLENLEQEALGEDNDFAPLNIAMIRPAYDGDKEFLDVVAEHMKTIVLLEHKYRNKDVYKPFEKFSPEDVSRYIETTLLSPCKSMKARKETMMFLEPIPLLFFARGPNRLTRPNKRFFYKSVLWASKLATCYWLTSDRAKKLVKKMCPNKKCPEVK